MKTFFALLICLYFALGGLAAAVPVTDAVTGVGPATATFHLHSSPFDCWFQWGTSTGNMIYRTPNESSCASGAYTQTNAPLLTSTTYYVKGCDYTGCGSAVSFTTSAANRTPQTHYGDGFSNITKSGFNVTTSFVEILRPYTDPIGSTGASGLSIVVGLLLFFVFSGYWLQGKDVTISVITATIAGGAFWLGASSVGVPAEFLDIGQGVMIAGLAGMFFAIFKR